MPSLLQQPAYEITTIAIVAVSTTLLAVGSNPWRSVKIRGWFFQYPFLAMDETRMEHGLNSRVGSWCFALGALFLDRIRGDR